MSDEEILGLYNQVLDSLLIPPYVKEQMIATQTKEKKIQTIQMHKDTLKDSKVLTQFGDQQRTFLTIIKSSKNPDINVIIKLRVFLSTANREILVAFIEANGILVLMKSIDNRLSKLPMTELDAALLFEMLSCYKCVLNNATGERSSSP